jgi:hypothetical protein
MSSSAADEHLAMANPFSAGTSADPVGPEPTDPAEAEPMEPADAQPSEPQPAGRNLGAARFAAILTLLAGGVTLGWTVAAVLASGHGLDVSDEGYYLLSYRWWNVNRWTFSGVQYLYGPIFQALGYDIAGLRLFRLVTVLFALVVFSWAFMRWLRTRRPNATPSRWWEAAGTAAIVASGGAVYGWLPLSPGYNDVALLGSLLTLTVIFWAAADADLGRRVPAWIPVAWGAVVVAMLLAKWSSSLVVLLAAAIALVVALWPARYRAIFRFAGWSIVGIAASVALVQFAIAPLTSVIPEMLALNKIVAGKTHAPAALLAMYTRTSLTVVQDAARTHLVLMIAIVVAVVVRGRPAQRLAWVLVAAGLAVSAWQALRGGGLPGGPPNLRDYPATLMAVVLVVLVAGFAVILAERLRRRRDSSLSHTGTRGWLLLIVLLAMPYMQAMGTNNALHLMAVNGFAAWMAVVIAMVTGMERAPASVRWATALVAAGGVLAAASIGTGGLLLHPYRSQSVKRTTAAVAGVPAFDSVRVTPSQAKRYHDLHELLRPYIEPPGRAIIEFDQMAGIVLLLDGRPVGEAWNSSADPQRTAAGITNACRNGPWWGSRLPLLLVKQPLTAVEKDALKSCELDFDADYKLVAPPQQTTGISVYVPVAG